MQSLIHTRLIILHTQQKESKEMRQLEPLSSSLSQFEEHRQVKEDITDNRRRLEKS